MTTDKSKKQKALSDVAKKFVMLAHSYNPDKHTEATPKGRQVSISDWLIYEKIDGVRAIFQDGILYSRNKKKFYAPKEFIDKIITKDNLILDGELFHPDGFQKTVSIVKDQSKKATMDYWNNIQYKVFDCKIESQFNDRLNTLKSNLQINDNIVLLPDLGTVKTDRSIPKALKKIQSKGGEGLILRNPKGVYKTGRSWDLLKVKTFIDCEATVIGMLPGEGKHSNRMGKLICVLNNGIQFECGTGFTDEEREQPPKVNSKITVKYFELTDEGKPRFPVYITERDYE